jgi:hypothetical protein
MRAPKLLLDVRVRLLAALLALGLGVAACLVAYLFGHGVVG